MPVKRSNKGSQANAVKPAARQKLEAEYRRLAKRADQRLVRLKGYRHDKGFENILQYAYRQAMQDIRSWSGKGAERFNTKPPESDADLKRKIADIKKFLASPTSSKKEILKRTKQMNENEKLFGQGEKGNFTWEEWAKFWDMVGNDFLDEGIDYRAAAKILSKQPRNVKRSKAKQRMDDMIISSDLDAVERYQERRLRELGITREMLR